MAATSSSSSAAAATIERRRISYGGHLLPLDIMAEILCRLPMRSLARFQCVCRQWRSLTHQHYFLHEKLGRQRRRRRLTMVQKSCTEKIDVYELDHDQEEGGTTSMTRSSNYYSLILSDIGHDPIIPTADDDVYKYECLLSNSFHGLVVCARLSPTHRLAYYLLNPIHKDLFVKLPDPPSLQIHEKFYYMPDEVLGIGIGFDDSTGEYKVVNLARRHKEKNHRVFEILTLGRGCGRGRGRDDNWRWVALPPEIELGPCTPLFLHGVLYWMGHFAPPRHLEHMIVTFDVKKEKLGPLIPFPNFYYKWHVVPQCLYEFKRHVCLVFIDYASLKMKIWILEEEEDCTLHKWTRICCFRKHYAPFWPTSNLYVVDVTDESILYQEPTGDRMDETPTWQLFAYHLHNKKLEWLQYPVFSQRLEMHQESFLSPREFF